MSLLLLLLLSLLVRVCCCCCCRCSYDFVASAVVLFVVFVVVLFVAVVAAAVSIDLFYSSSLPFTPYVLLLLLVPCRVSIESFLFHGSVTIVVVVVAAAATTSIVPCRGIDLINYGITLKWRGEEEETSQIDAILLARCHYCCGCAYRPSLSNKNLVWSIVRSNHTVSCLISLLLLCFVAMNGVK